jgi:hypothetical protein
MLWHFYNGRPQMIFWMNDIGFNNDIDLERYDVLFRPTFFYANFWIPLGLSIIYSFTNMTMNNELSIFKRMLMAISLPVNIVALIMNNTRAMIFPVLIILGFITIILAIKTIKNRQLFKKNIVFILLIIISINIISEYLITPSQRIALYERSNDSISLVMRWSIWSSVILKIFDNPLRALIGWGPQATSRQLGGKDIQYLLTGKLGNVEGAFDSTIIGFIIEYGLLFSLFVFSFMIFMYFKILIDYFINRNILSFCILMMSTALILSHIFQQYSVGPPGLLALQVFAFIKFKDIE